MRYRLSTILAVIVLVGLALAWWRDRSQLATQVDLQQPQIRQLQRQVDEGGRSGFFMSSFRFQNTAALIQFVETATEEEFQQENWGAWSSSPIAEQTAEPLAKLVSSPNDATRHHAAWLLGGLGSKKRPLAFDPVPALVAAINDPSSRVRGESFYALGNFGPAAAAALPALRKRMKQDQSHAFMAALAVKGIDPQTDIGPRLRELFVAGDKNVWRNVATHLPAHLPPAEARQLLLAQSQAETDMQAREILAMALNKIKE